MGRGCAGDKRESCGGGILELVAGGRTMRRCPLPLMHAGRKEGDM